MCWQLSYDPSLPHVPDFDSALRLLSESRSQTRSHGAWRRTGSIRGRPTSSAHCSSCASETRRKDDGSPGCPLNFAPLGQLDGDHADHPGCWLRVLPGPFPPVQTMSEVDPSAEVERAGRCDSVCQVRCCENVALVFHFLVIFLTNETKV